TLPSGTAVNVDAGATFDLGGNSVVIGSLNGAGTVKLSGIGALGTGGGAFSGVINGTGDLVKLSGGTLTLSGADTYSGNTSIEGGALQLGANNAVPANGLVDVYAGAGFELGNFNDTIGALAGAGFVGFSASLTTGGSNLSTVFSGDMNGFVGHLTKT